MPKLTLIVYIVKVQQLRVLDWDCKNSIFCYCLNYFRNVKCLSCVALLTLKRASWHLPSAPMRKSWTLNFCLKVQEIYMNREQTLVSSAYRMQTIPSGFRFNGRSLRISVSCFHQRNTINSFTLRSRKEKAIATPFLQRLWVFDWLSPSQQM